MNFVFFNQLREEDKWRRSMIWVTFGVVWGSYDEIHIKNAKELINYSTKPGKKKPKNYKFLLAFFSYLKCIDLIQKHPNTFPNFLYRLYRLKHFLRIN